MLDDATARSRCEVVVEGSGGTTGGDAGPEVDGVGALDVATVEPTGSVPGLRLALARAGPPRRRFFLLTGGAG
ncbi:MAG: hypothetical protein AB1Z98_01840 [Nannocystaceae bacterium]